ncbi:MAG: flagellar biosynthetic protein FliR [Chitinophagales bacterium]
MGISFETLLLVFGRTAGLFISAPIFNSRQVPIQVKIFLAIMISGIITMVTPIKIAVPLNTPGYFLCAVVFEFLVGYTLGFVVSVVFASIQLAGQYMDTQIGFGIVNVMDPQSGIQVPLIGNFQYILALLVFLGVDGHHLILQALHESYRLIPVLGANFDNQFVQFMMQIGAYMFLVAIKIAAPIVVALFIADVTLGFMARIVPQMNIFMVGMPLKIVLGMGVIMAIIPVFIWLFKVVLVRFFGYLDILIMVLGK